MIWKKNTSIDTDKEKIEEAISRSIDTIYPSRDALRELLLSGKQISVYVGIDPTADYVHLGHSTNYLILERLHKLGHKIIVLVGDFTAMIGDPSDKTSARIPLTEKDVQKNLTSFKQQIGKILDFKNKQNPIEFRFNSEWLAKLSLKKIIELSSNFTVQHMLERDMFEKRMQEKKPLFVHEFFYPLLQGYDSVALAVDMEIGGTDQTFNMLAGRTLVKRYLNRDKFVMTTTLLENPVTGEKLMSKSLGTGIGLNESAENMFGKIMALADEGIEQMFTDCTRLSRIQIAEKKDRLMAGENPKNLKIELAHEIVGMYHGVQAADRAQKNFQEVFSAGGVPENILTISADSTKLLGDVFVDEGSVSSKTQWRRLVEEGAVVNIETKEKILDPFTRAHHGTYRIGKKTFIRIE